MKRCTLFLLAACLSAAACNKSDPANANANASANAGAGTNANAANGTPTLIPEHGGTVATSAGLITEVVNEPSGKFTAYVRSPDGPVANAQVAVKVRGSDGSEKPVSVAWDAQANGYVGYVWGVAPGQHTVDVTVGGELSSTPPQTVSSSMNITPLPRLPDARYGGTVEVIGQYAVEIVPARSGDVAFFVMNMDGTPVPAANVQLPSVIVDPGTGPGGTAAPAHARAVALTPQPAGTNYFVARADPALFAHSPSVNIYVDINGGGHTYTHAEVPHAVVVAAMPPAVSMPRAVPVQQRPVEVTAFARPPILLNMGRVHYGTIQRPDQDPNSAHVVLPGSVGANMPANGVVVNPGMPTPNGPVQIGPGPAPVGMQVGGQINPPPGPNVNVQLGPPRVPGMPGQPMVMPPGPNVGVAGGPMPPPNVPGMPPQPMAPPPGPNLNVNPNLPAPNVPQPAPVGIAGAVHPGVSPIIPQPVPMGAPPPGPVFMHPPPGPGVVPPPPGPTVVAPPGPAPVRPPPGPAVFVPPPAAPGAVVVGRPEPVRQLPNPIPGPGPVIQPGAPPPVGVQGHVEVHGEVRAGQH